MRMLALILSATVISACSSGFGDPSGAASAPTPVSPPSGQAAELPAQTLAPQSCGLFLFERRPPNRFVLFEDQSRRSVKIVHEGRIHELGVSEQRGALTTGDSFRRVYLDPAENLTFTLTGQVGDETGSGPRLEDVLLTVRSLDGARVVRPLGGVRSCNEGGG